jgi:hypothetical protein
MSVLTELGKERKSLSDVPIHLTGFSVSSMYVVYKYTYTNMFVKSGLRDGFSQVLRNQHKRWWTWGGLVPPAPACKALPADVFEEEPPFSDLGHEEFIAREDIKRLLEKGICV